MLDSKELYDLLVKIQSIAKIGLVFSTDPYAISNYNEINDLTKAYLEKVTDVQIDRPNYFQRDIYPTPSISVRTLIFNDDKTKILMVREAKLQTYSFPGGWADLYDSPSEAAKKECEQEAGAKVELVRLIGVTNRTPFKANISVPEYLIAFEGRLVGELHEHEYETDDVGWFDIHNLPEISRKVSRSELDKLIDAALTGKTIFD